MVIIFRVLLMLVPVIGLLLWLRWRAKRNTEDGVSEKDVVQLRRGLIGLVLTLIVAALGIRFTDESGGSGDRYVPARVEDGKVVPGHFERNDAEEAQSEETPETGEDNSENSPS